MLVLAGALLLWGAAPASARARRATVKRLVQAVKAGKRVQIARAAAALGVHRLVLALRSKRAEVRAAALEGISRFAGGALLLADVVDLMRRRWTDSAEVARAALAMRRVAERLRPRLMRRLGLRPEMIASVARDVAHGARERSPDASRRVALLQALAQLDEIAKLPEGERLAVLRAAGVPAVQLAALELFAGRRVGKAAAAALTVLVRSAKVAVARRAAAVLCS
ncbi:MAG: hypothetical protein KC503_18455, partial [Myxococcales bacterium]|nr:hypothetical protein [Myxococcales bacterium]